MKTEAVRLDALIARLRAAATEDALSIGDVWTLLTKAADALEKIFLALDCETERPCCLERVECAEGCSFEIDSPEGYSRMLFMRELMMSGRHGAEDREQAKNCILTFKARSGSADLKR